MATLLPLLQPSAGRYPISRPGPGEPARPCTERVDVLHRVTPSMNNGASAQIEVISWNGACRRQCKIRIMNDILLAGYRFTREHR